MKFIFRDDDISKNTTLDLIKYVHEQFLLHHQTHTIAVICEGLEKNKPLIDYVNSTKNWDICIHGWTHSDYCSFPKSKIEEDLDKCILKIEECFNRVPEKWYLPNNGWSAGSGFNLVPKVADISIYHGVDVDTDCDHISHFTKLIEDGGTPTTNTIYFNSWDREDLMLLPNLLYLTRSYNEKIKER